MLLIKVYHDFYWLDDSGHWPKVDAGSNPRNWREALKPGGVLLLVDHSAKPGTASADATPLHRIDEAYAVEEFCGTQLKVIAKSDAT